MLCVKTLKERRVPVSFFLNSNFIIKNKKSGKIEFQESFSIISKLLRKTNHCFDNKKLAKLAGAEYLGEDDMVFQKNDKDCGPASLKMITPSFQANDNSLSNSSL